jgi:hypothetical protein
MSSAMEIDGLIGGARELRDALVRSVETVHPNNMASDGATTVQGALLDLRAAIDAFLGRDDPDNAITGEASTE